MVAVVTIGVLVALVVGFGLYYWRHDRSEFADPRTATRRRRGGGALGGTVFHGDHTGTSNGWRDSGGSAGDGGGGGGGGSD